MATSSDIFRQVASAVDIVDVIGEHLALKRAGREFKCLCPFHEDHRPSMAVVPHKQIFHCFVCGTGGDVFKFVELYHKMGKGEALRMLAQRAGIKLPELPGRTGGASDKDKDGLTARERIANTNEWACGFFEKYLRSPLGKAGLDYLHSRGLSDDTITKFRLGMAPDSWTGMSTAALRLGISNENLAEAGLIKQRQDGSPYDAFRNRVMFPIIDASGGGGRVIAFGGRVLVEKRDEAGNVVEAKYLNSPDSRLFNKSESLYGLNHARQQIIRTRTAVVVEGYMDVIACHQVGVTNVIATLGTALTPDHARILKNYAQTVVLVFDSDDAGRRAADRTMEVFVSTLDIKIASVPDGKDPCDFCIKYGRDPFQKLIDEALDALSFKWNGLQALIHGTDSVGARQEAIKSFISYAAVAMKGKGGIHEIDPIRRGQLIVKLAKLVGLPVEDVTALLYSASYKETPRKSTKSEDPESLAARIRRESQLKPGRNAEIDAHRWALGCLINNPMLYPKFQEDLDLRWFKKYTLLARVLIEYFEWSSELEQCSLADFTNHVQSLAVQDDDTSLALYCSILWDRMVGDWLDPVHLSAETAKLVTSWKSQLGHTPELVIRDCIEFLKELYGPMQYEEAVPVEHLSDEERELHDLKIYVDQIAEKNRRGKNRRKVGVEMDSTKWPASRERIEKLEEVAVEVGS